MFSCWNVNLVHILSLAKYNKTIRALFVSITYPDATQINTVNLFIIVYDYDIFINVTISFSVMDMLRVNSFFISQNFKQTTIHCRLIYSLYLFLINFFLTLLSNGNLVCSALISKRNKKLVIFISHDVEFENAGKLMSYIAF